MKKLDWSDFDGANGVEWDKDCDASDEQFDGDEWWRPGEARLNGLHCSHCDDPIEKGDKVLGTSDGGLLHADCWELHEGFTRAMAKDD